EKFSLRFSLIGLYCALANEAQTLMSLEFAPLLLSKSGLYGERTYIVKQTEEKSHGSTAEGKSHGLRMN
ncbi:MAG: hypothetical protein IKM86_01100, partial [Acidaminococcaceae bacterium]|nr:hypothetical protein [Acidaminococcaceae bacterium]